MKKYERLEIRKEEWPEVKEQTVPELVKVIPEEDESSEMADKLREWGFRCPKGDGP